jgi:hypothetical protein
MTNSAFPHCQAFGGSRRGKSDEKISFATNPRNPLKSLDSDERIQGNPSESKAP